MIKVDLMVLNQDVHQDICDLFTRTHSNCYRTRGLISLSLNKLSDTSCHRYHFAGGSVRMLGVSGP